MGKKELYDFNAKLIHQTEKAYLLRIENTKEVWLPKESVDFDGSMVTIPERFVIEKELDGLVD